MSEERIEKKGKTVSVRVERKLNLGDYNSVTVSTHYSSGTMDADTGDDEVEERAEEIASLATRRVHEELYKIKESEFDELAGKDEESLSEDREDTFDDLKEKAEKLSE